MAAKYVEDYAKSKGITAAEAVEHAIIKEYLKYHPMDKEEEMRITQTTLVAGCGCANQQ